MPQYYREFEDLYRQLYWCYDCCNYHGWNGALPPVALILNRSTRPSHVAGYAQPHATAVNGTPYHAISLTLNIVGKANSASVIPVLLHEMTHIWQFWKGRRGGHGKDFRNEMLRLGIDEAGQRVQNGGVLDRIGHEVEVRYPGMASRMRECLRSPLRSSKQLDFAFFRKVLEERR